MRGTLHVVSAADIRWILSLLTPRTIASTAPRYRELELDSETLSMSRQVLEHSLAGGKQLTRKEVAIAFEEAGIPTDGQRLSFLLLRAGLDQVICFGVKRPTEFAYTLRDEWAPIGRSFVPDDSLAELARRYFRSHGPATLQDFVWWSGLTVTDARTGLARIQTELIELKIENQSYWMSQELGDEAAGSRQMVLLPGFDEYLLGYKDRSAVLDPIHAAKVCPGGNGVFAPMIIVDGRIVRTWMRKIKKDGAVVEAMPFGEFDKEEKRFIAAAAEGYVGFLGLR